MFLNFARFRFCCMGVRVRVSIYFIFLANTFLISALLVQFSFIITVINNQLISLINKHIQTLVNGLKDICVRLLLF